MKYEIGWAVKSLAGHDQNSYYIIIEEKNDKLLLANGRDKTLKKPKVKNKKHVQLIKTDETLIKEKLISGQIIDADLIHILKLLRRETDV